MLNLDNQATTEQKVQALAQLMAQSDATAVANQIVNLMSEDSARQMAEITKLKATIREVDEEDASAVMAHGGRKLTQAERKVYAKFADAARNSDKKQQVKAFTELLQTLPNTVYNYVFEQLSVEHKLLSRITYIPTLTSTFIVSNGTTPTAFWSDVCGDIEELLGVGFSVVSPKAHKLSGYFPLCNALVDLGAVWLDRYIRQILSESIVSAIEGAIIDGDGNQKPIGMTRLIDTVSNNVNAAKPTVALNAMTAQELAAKVLAPLTKDGKRDLGQVLFIVNPLDYYDKLYGLGVAQTAQGTWVFDKFPIPEMDLIRSTHVPRNMMIAGVGKDYFLSTGDTVIDSSKDVRFLQDETVYAAKTYASGQPIDNESFIILDISSIGLTEEP